MKIFLGTSEIAGMMTFLADAYRKLGHEVTTCTDNYGHGFYDNKYDIILNRSAVNASSKNRYLNGLIRRINDFRQRRIRYNVFLRERDKHDVYIFMWNGFFPNSISDYEYLKSKGKKIISLFLGSDVRHVSAFQQEYQLDVSQWEQWFHNTDINTQIFRLRKAEMFSDAIFSLPDQAGLAIRPYNHIYIPFDLSKFRVKPRSNKTLKVVHIPSRTGIKGTKFILETIERIKNEGIELEFELITGVPNTVVLEKLQGADVLVDEIFLHGPGTLSLEGIASGCAVATKTLPKGVYDDVAVCNVNFDNLYDKLKRLITDDVYRYGFMNNGKSVIEAVNDPLKIVSNILEKAFEDRNMEELRCDHRPRFFLDKYILPAGTLINNDNKALTKLIMQKYSLFDGAKTDRMKLLGLI